MTSTSAPPNQKRVVCPEMCFLCFNTLYTHLNPHSSKQVGRDVPSFAGYDAYPLFVTWTKGSNKKLRGCIGNFSPLELDHGLRDYALQSALHDTRFSPISMEEFDSLNVAVSLLTNFEEAKDYLDWTIGVHGVRIEFKTGSQRRSSTYLPEVMTETGWSKVETIDSLIRKAGYNGTIDDELRQSIKLVRYQSEKCTISYADYLKWKQQS